MGRTLDVSLLAKQKRNVGRDQVSGFASNPLLDYLGAVTPNHREVGQLAPRHNQVLAIVVWTRAARKLAARETWLGWDSRTRTRRLPLLVQNNRFLVLSILVTILEGMLPKSA